MTELSLIVKVTAVLAAALAIVRGARTSPASVRALMLASAFLLILVLPLASAVLPARAIQVPATYASPVMVENLLEAPVTPPIRSFAPVPAAADQRQMPPLTTIARTVWAAGAIAFLLPLVIGLVRLRRVRARGLPWLNAPLAAPADVLLHEDVAAPMTYGFVRPAIVLPIDAPAWSAADVRHALLHEIEHVRRRDWPVHLMARITCALYWFHPLAWMAWRQLCLESERACDDAVLREADSTAYAEQLVSLARRLSQRSPIPLLSMADRSSLSTRVAAVLSTNIARGRASARGALAIIGGAVILGLLVSPLRAVQTEPTAAAAFEVASIKRNMSGEPGQTYRMPAGSELVVTNMPAADLIRLAYGVQGFQLFNVPDWAINERYDILAKPPEGTRLTGRTMPALLRQLLADRMGLRIRRETRSLPIYRLVRTTDTREKLRPSSANCAPAAAGTNQGAQPAPAGGPACAVLVSVGRINMTGQPMDVFVAQGLSRFVDRKVVDATGLTGNWDLELTFAPDRAAPSSVLADTPSIFTALQEQLGLKLEPETGPVDVLVIEGVERPTPNDAPAPSTEPTARQASAATVFEVASIKVNKTGTAATGGDRAALMFEPGGALRATNTTLRALVLVAYRDDITRAQLAGGPDWIANEAYDILARGPEGAVTPGALDKTGAATMQEMLKRLLADRFKLRAHFEMREGTTYALTVASNGPKLKSATPIDCDAVVSDLARACHMFNPLGRRGMYGQHVDSADIAAGLQTYLGAPVSDRTGLKGLFEIAVHWNPDDGGSSAARADAGEGQPNPEDPGVFTALEEQIGLKLQSARGPVRVLVIDSAAHPTEN